MWNQTIIHIRISSQASQVLYCTTSILYLHKRYHLFPSVKNKELCIHSPPAIDAPIPFRNAVFQSTYAALRYYEDISRFRLFNNLKQARETEMVARGDQISSRGVINGLFILVGLPARLLRPPANINLSRLSVLTTNPDLSIADMPP